MRLFLASLIALFAIFFVVGCGSSDPMVGTWKMELSEELKKNMPKDQKVDVVAEFKADKTFSVSMDMMGRKDTVSGTYELKDKTLTMKQTMESGKPSNETSTATLSDDMKSFSAPGTESMGKMVKQ
jgi:uncharacterized protein (TIGR03066 family)